MHAHANVRSLIPDGAVEPDLPSGWRIPSFTPERMHSSNASAGAPAYGTAGRAALRQGLDAFAGYEPDALHVLVT